MNVILVNNEERDWNISENKKRRERKSNSFCSEHIYTYIYIFPQEKALQNNSKTMDEMRYNEIYE